MKKTILSALILATIALGISCNKTEENLKCAETKIAKVLKVEGATTVGVNTALTLNISIEGLNGCAGFGKYAETTIDNITQIETTAKYEGCVCTQALITFVVPYNFIRSTPGNYILKFSQPDNSFITHTVTVN